MTNSLKIIKYNNPDEFLEDIREYISLRYFEYFIFIKAIERVFSKREDIFKAFTIKRNTNIEIIYMWTNYHQYIFGETDNIYTIKLFISSFDIAKETSLFGSKPLIDNILKESNLKINLVKHRLYFSSSQVKEPLIVAKGKIGIAFDSDLIEISSLGLAFYTEEFNGEGLQSDEQVVNGIISGINDEMVFYLKNENEIVSYMQVIDKRNSKLMIGSIYTKPKLRGNGYGKTLVYKLSKKLSSTENNEFGFIVNSDNLASINMFSSIGFKKIYETGIYEQKQDVIINN